MATEYLPINPCTGCERHLMAQMENTFGLDGKCVCALRVEYQSNLAALETMLEHLPLFGIKQGHIEGIDCYCIPKSRISSILATIREAKG
jgi:hypothetical protein